jgi:hypothetical protein
MKRLETEEKSSGREGLKIWNNEVTEATADKRKLIKFSPEQTEI